MNTQLFLQVLVNGLMSGGMYALVAAGFTLILGVLRIFNIAQGHFYMLGAFVTYAALTYLKLQYPIAVIAAMLAMAILGLLLHFGVLKWTMPHGFFHSLLATIAFGTIISQTSLLTFGFNDRVVPAVIDGVFKIGSITLNNGKLVVIAGSIIVMAVLYLFMKTKWGIAMMAASENREVAELQGINVNRIFWVAVAVGCGLCGAAGALIVPVLSASLGMEHGIFLRVMLVVLIAGTGSMSGALIAAFLIGIIESFAYQIFNEFNMIVIFAFVAILMYFRPGGLVGKPLPLTGE